jgi:hypothetical protein
LLILYSLTKYSALFVKRKKGYFRITAHNNQPLGCVALS